MYWLKTRILLVLLVIVTTLIPMTVTMAGDIAASPAVITAEGVILGKTIFIHDIEIINQTDHKTSYLIYSKKPSTLREGYQDVYDPRWISFEKTEVTIDAQSKTTVGVSVRIPNNITNSEKHYEAWVIVREKVTGLVALELAIRVLMTTNQYDSNLPEESQPMEPIPVDTSPTQAISVASPTPIASTTPQYINSPIPTNSSDNTAGTSQFPVIPVVAISCGTLIIVTLIITLLGRKRR